MRWSFQIANVAGTVVRVHVTFLILLAWVALAFLFKGGTGEAIGALVFTVALFGCVLLHEFGHVFAARAFGIRTPDITLLPIGGLARLEKMPDKPWQEMIVAIAGPLVNIVIALLLLLVVGVPDLADPALLNFTSPTGLLLRLLVINIWLVVFNMIPAFPMDGGRVLRAMLAMVMPYAKATSVAATTGQVLAGIGAVIGLLLPNPILMLIALFIFFAARGESAAVTQREALRDITLDQAMMTDFQTLPNPPACATPSTCCSPAPSTTSRCSPRPAASPASSPASNSSAPSPTTAPTIRSPPSSSATSPASSPAPPSNRRCASCTGPSARSSRSSPPTKTTSSASSAPRTSANSS